MPMPTAWPSAWCAWEAALQPGSWLAYKRVRNISLRCTAGNVALAVVNGLDEGTAVVGHLSQEIFRPHMEVQAGTLRIRQSVNLLNFKRQSSRINTLILAPPGLQSVELSLIAGEVWLFGDLAAAPMQSVKATNVAGDVTLVDMLATEINARNKLGDVNLCWDAGEATDPMPAADVRASGRTMLGDVHVAVSGLAAAPPTWLQTALHVSLIARDDYRASGGAKRLKWLRGTGREFFEREGEHLNSIS